jgi:hypothetical protein
LPKNSLAGGSASLAGGSAYPTRFEVADLLVAQALSLASQEFFSKLLV